MNCENYVANNQLLVEESHQQQQQQQYVANTKKKCRGNRRLQRFRRNCRKKGMKQQTNKSFHYNDQDTTSNVKIIDGSVYYDVNSNNGKSLEIEVKSRFQGISDIGNIDNFVFRNHRIIQMKINALQKNQWLHRNNL